MDQFVIDVQWIMTERGSLEIVCNRGMGTISHTSPRSGSGEQESKLEESKKTAAPIPLINPTPTSCISQMLSFLFL